MMFHDVHSALRGDSGPLPLQREHGDDVEGRRQVPCHGWRARSLQAQRGEHIIKQERKKQTKTTIQQTTNK